MMQQEELEKALSESLAQQEVGSAYLTINYTC